jgi:hypothetical protein
MLLIMELFDSANEQLWYLELNLKPRYTILETFPSQRAFLLLSPVTRVVSLSTSCTHCSCLNASPTYPVLPSVHQC